MEEEFEEEKKKALQKKKEVGAQHLSSSATFKYIFNI